MPEGRQKTVRSTTGSRSHLNISRRSPPITAANLQPRPMLNSRLHSPLNSQSHPAVDSQLCPPKSSRDRFAVNSRTHSTGLATYSRPTMSSQLRSVAPRVHSVLNSQSPLEHPPGIFSNNSSTNQPVTRKGTDQNNKASINLLTQRATPVAESTGLVVGSIINPHDFIIQQAIMVDGINERSRLAQHIIPGAQFDSGERYPPPSCHPGTRLDISEKLVSWMRDPMRKHKLAWLQGHAGVGKSAVIQTLAESEASSSTSILGATIFFSKSDERDDSQRVITTIAYQLAVKYSAYRAYVAELLVVNPLVVKKSLVEQFKWLIIKPFVEKRLFGGTHGAILITLDGLDECNGDLAQREIILLVGKFCLEHPTAPFIWIISSRPEPQICTAFSHRDVQRAYLEIDMPVNSNQACRDTERYLRDKFIEIREKYSTSFSSAQQWPTETDLTKIAKRSSGLFAFANAVTRFTDDDEYANPIAQMQKVLDVLESPSSPAAEDSPFAALDILYTLVMSAISPNVLPITRRLLLVKDKWCLAHACNILSIDQAAAYSALRKLHSVLFVPQPTEAYFKGIQVFHKSFDDYLESKSRSNSFWLNPLETESVVFPARIRILLEAHDAAKRNVSPLNIKVSWLYGDVERHQKVLFARSLRPVLQADKTEDLGELRYVFRDIDYASFGSLFQRLSDAIPFVDEFFTSPLLASFEEWGVITTLPFRSLDLDSISLDEPTYVFSTQGDTLSIRHYFDENFIKAAFPHCSRATNEHWHTWYEKIMLLRDDHAGKNHLYQHLNGLTPSHRVTVMGTGNRRLALVGIDDKELQFYMLPYRPS